MEPGTELEYITMKKLIAQSMEQQRMEFSKLLEKELAQQKVHSEERLEKQANTFSKLMRVVLDSNNERVDQATKFVMELKSSLQFTLHEVDKLTLTVTRRTLNNLRLPEDPGANYGLP